MPAPSDSDTMQRIVAEVLIAADWWLETDNPDKRLLREAAEKRLRLAIGTYRVARGAGMLTGWLRKIVDKRRAAKYG